VNEGAQFWERIAGSKPSSSIRGPVFLLEIQRKKLTVMSLIKTPQNLTEKYFAWIVLV